MPREWAEKVAHLYYRARNFNRCLEILAPFVRPLDAITRPTDPEAATYAIALIKIGSAKEGMQILSSLNGRVPEAHLYSAFGHQATWDYEQAIPHLETYIAAPGIDAYQVAVARVNLVWALISVRQLDAAEKLMAQTLRDAKQNRWTLLFKNLQFLSAELFIARRDWPAARSVLAEARRDRYKDNSVFDFFLRKSAAIADLLSQETDPVAARETIARLRNEAIQFDHFESIREFDHHIAVADRDRRLFLKVYFGTPYPAFRKLLLQDWPDFELPDTYIFGSDDGRRLDLSSGRIGAKDSDLRPGQLIHRGIASLCSDFYRPLFIGELYASLFPGEYYNPGSAPDRVANAIKRIRKWILAANLPMKIIIRGRRHSIQITGPGFGISVAADSNRTATKSDAVLFESLRHYIVRRTFAAADVADCLRISRSSALRLLNKGIELGKIEQLGFNKSTRYRFSNEAA